MTDFDRRLRHHPGSGGAPRPPRPARIDVGTAVPDPNRPDPTDPAGAASDPAQSRLAGYYRDRAPEYDRIYQKPERQADLAKLEALVQRWVTGRNVLELACGTGWWTQVMARSARSVTATDLNQSVLEIAGRREYGRTPVTFRIADAWNLHDIPGVFDCVFAGFWISHLRRERIRGFLDSLDDRLGLGGRVVLLDNRFVEGSSTPISRTDEHGDTFQIRRLDDGREFEVLKNFFGKSDLMHLLDAPSRFVELKEMPHYWAAVYDRGTPG
ncbi:MAG: methyltransferase domain-containing protein [Gemmatimonadetes bacterium]|nr:methyltransferase domain-containing protein [Gemmatimonadota bacterium]